MPVPAAWTTRPTSRTVESGSHEADQGARGEQDHRRQEDLAGTETLQEESGRRNDNGHGEHECTGQPLAELWRNPQRSVELWDRNGHRRFVEDRDEGGDQQQPDHPHSGRIDGVSPRIVGTGR